MLIVYFSLSEDKLDLSLFIVKIINLIPRNRDDYRDSIRFGKSIKQL